MKLPALPLAAISFAAAGALLVAACSKEPSPSPAKQASPAPSAPAPGPVVGEQKADPSKPADAHDHGGLPGIADALKAPAKDEKK